MTFSLIFYWSAGDGHSKREVLEIYNMNKKNVIARFLFFLIGHQLVNNLQFLAKRSRDISRDLLTHYLYFKMLRTMSSLCVPNFNSQLSSMPKL